MIKVSQDKNDVVIRIPEGTLDIKEIHEIVDYFTFCSLTTKSKARDKDVENLSNDIDRAWRNANKKRFTE
ncbi:MAG TPA: hypothetical protein ENN08_04135 [Bacteroidales bacterium]|nr:hypothetical protein [Bacteroidales bacterium]